MGFPVGAVVAVASSLFGGGKKQAGGDGGAALLSALQQRAEAQRRQAELEAKLRAASQDKVPGQSDALERARMAARAFRGMT